MLPDDPNFDLTLLESVYRRLPGDAVVVELLAETYTRVGRYEDGLKLDRKLVRLRPTHATAHYNLACSLSLTGRFPAALNSLRRALACGFDDVSWLFEDPDLAALRARRSFRQLVRDLQLEAAG